MNSRPDNANYAYQPVPHRLALALVGVVFPLIWVGGLVTTYDAGMAVPDWPGTYGYNLFSYPLATWLAGPWNLFIEHGHRLLGAAAGLVTLTFLAAVMRYEQRRFMGTMAAIALLLVVSQGVIGGLRVVLNARTIALIHGCVGPLFFAFCTLCVVLTSRAWFVAKPLANAGTLTRSALVGLVLAYAQLVLGAVLRHPSDDGSPAFFRLALLFHLVIGLALVGHIAGLAFSIHRRAKEHVWLQLPAQALVGLAVAQIMLGLCTLVVKYGWPVWLGGEILAPNFTVQAKSFWGAMVITGHVANGSLILALLALLWLRCVRTCGNGWTNLPEAAWKATEVLA